MASPPSTQSIIADCATGVSAAQVCPGMPGMPPRTVPLSGKLPPPVQPAVCPFWWRDDSLSEHAASSSMPYAFNKVWDSPLEPKAHCANLEALIGQTGDKESQGDNVTSPELRKMRRRAHAELLLESLCESDMPAAAALLVDKEIAIRSAALEALGRNAKVGAGLAPNVAALLHDEVSSIRLGALQALGNMGSAAQPFVGKVGDCLLDQSSLVQRAACETLAALGSAGTSHAPKVAKFLGSYDWQLRMAAQRTLVVMGESGARASMNILLDTTAPVEARAAAAELLGAMGDADALGEASSEVITTLEKCLSEDMHSTVRRKACIALGSTAAIALYDDEDTGRIASRLVNLFGSKDDGVSRAAAEALTKLDADATEYAPAFAQLQHRFEVQLVTSDNLPGSQLSSAAPSRKASYAFEDAISIGPTPRGSTIGSARGSTRGSTISICDFPPIGSSPRASTLNCLHPMLAMLNPAAGANNNKLSPTGFTCSRKGNGRLSYLPGG